MSLSRAQAPVEAFHKKFNLGAPRTPLDPHEVNWEHHQERHKWIGHERDELQLGIYDRSIAETADGYIDILVFALGGLVKLGIDASPLFEAVIESQMTKIKVYGIAKLQKPANWKHPDIAGLLEKQSKR